MPNRSGDLLMSADHRRLSASWIPHQRQRRRYGAPTQLRTDLLPAQRHLALGPESFQQGAEHDLLDDVELSVVFRLGGWFVQFGGKDLEEWNKVALEEALGAEAWLLGRRSYEFFGVRWRPRSGNLADRLNSMPKYVVSSTLVDPDWNNSTVLKGDVVEEVSKLKQELDGEIVVPASYQLGRTLIEHDLVDELRLVVFPVVLGAGERLFGETSDKKPMRLVDTKAIGDGLVFLSYEFAREA
jgi:dihydrofolate reductase